MKLIDISTPKYPHAYTIIDEDDFCRVSTRKWGLLKTGDHCGVLCTIRRSGVKRSLFLHRYLLNAQTGQEVDHINGNGLDNRKSNLRLCTHAENVRNRKKSPGKSSIYKGVSWHKGNESWRSKIRPNNKEIFLGYYKNELDAAVAYDKKAKEVFGEFAKLNFPDISGCCNQSVSCP